jgi:predicted hotdog family 3-hydroxylacyl-ACP dehydratase
MMRDCPYPVAALLPHEPPMILIDEVRGWEQGRLDATVDIRPGIPFFEAGQGVPAHVGIEYMAQACGAYAGLEAVTAGLPVRLGLLLGTRRYLSAVSWFAPGQQLLVRVAELFRDGTLGMFDCRIEGDGRELAVAQLSVYLLEPGAALPSSAAEEQGTTAP